MLLPVTAQILIQIQQVLRTFGITQHEARLTWLIKGLT